MASTTNDKRLTAVEDERKDAISDSTKMYNDMASESEKYYQAQIDASKEWATEQQKNQQAQTDFAIEKIEQQKDQATKDYTKEQSGAYVDWQKESNRYGANAEEMAASGLANTGYSESSQVQMYTAYQNRVATARETYNRAILNYDNAIKDAQLQNNSVLAEIAYNALQQQLELGLQGFQYKNQLLMEGANRKLEIQKTYDSKYQNVLNQINAENALAEQKRQFDAQQKQQKEIAAAQLAEQKRQFDLTHQGYSGSGTITKSTKSAAEKAGAKAFRDSVSYMPKVTKKSGSSGSTSTKTHSSGSKREVSTDYYQGSLNPDAKKYGTFKNGYQPKGISGHGELKKTRLTTTLDTIKQYGANAGQAVTVKQNIWQAKDGTRWYWEGRENKYKQIK